MCVKNRTTGRYFEKYTTPMMRNVCTGEMLPVIFFYIKYAMVLHLSIPCTDNYTGNIDLINYVYTKNNSMSDSINST